MDPITLMLLAGGALAAVAVSRKGASATAAAPARINPVSGKPLAYTGTPVQLTGVRLGAPMANASTGAAYGAAAGAAAGKAPAGVDYGKAIGATAGAAGAAAGCSALGGVGAAAAPLCASVGGKVGAVVGDKVEDWGKSAVDTVKGWF